MLTRDMNTKKPISGRGPLSVRSKRHTHSASSTYGSIGNLLPSSVMAPPCIALRCAIQAAAIALQSQADKFGEPLILHVIRATNHCSSVEDRIAVLTEAMRYCTAVKHHGFCQSEDAIPFANTIEGSTYAWGNGSADIVSFPNSK